MRRSTKNHSCVFETLESRRLLCSSGISTAVSVPLASAALESSAAGTGLTGEYFLGDDFQTPVVVRSDKTINFDWPHGRPDEVIPKSTVFTAQWTGTVQAPTTGVYTFYTASDSGTEVVVDGDAVINNLAARSASTQSGTISLTAGQAVPILVQYISRGSGASSIKLLWSAAGGRKQVVPRSALVAAQGVTLPAREPLVGTYYGGYNFQTELLTRVDSTIDFNFGAGGVPDSVIPLNYPFSVQWVGTIEPTTTGTYSFETITDDGVRLYVNGAKIISNWTVHSATANFGKIQLQAGQFYTVTMQYFQDGVGHDLAELFSALVGHREQVVQFTQPPLLELTAPLDVTAVPLSTSQINLSWNDVPNETGFTIDRSSDGGATFTVAGTTAQGVTTFSDTGLTPSTLYEYEVIATNGSVASPPSAETSATTLPTPLAAAVASASVSGTTATITWTPVTGATSYLVETSSNGSTGWSTVGSTAGTSLTDSGLSTGTAYYFRVTASDSYVSSATSNVVSVTTVPAAPTLTATPSSASQINLSWNDVTGETGFTVEQSTNGTSGWTEAGNTAAGTTTIAVGGLSASTTYYYRVLADGAGGSSVPSNVANATTSAAAPAYASLTAMYGVTSAGVVYNLNLSNGALSQIGTLSFGTNAAGRDPISGDLYYVSGGSSSQEIAAWNPTYGTNHVINASVNLDGTVSVAAFSDNGAFFVATDAGTLYSLNRVTGVATNLGTLSYNGSTFDVNNGDIAFGSDGNLYIMTGGTLYSVSSAAIAASTGSNYSLQVVFQVNPGLGNLQIAFGQNGQLYGTNSAGQLYVGDVVTAPAMAIGSPSGVALNDLASVPLNADLAITQSASAFTHGQNGTYTINVTNNGPDATVGPIQVTDTLAAGLSFVAGSGTDWTYNISGSVVTMTYTGSIRSGAIPTATLTVGIGSSVTSPVVNTVTASTTIFNPNTPDDTSTISTAVN